MDDFTATALKNAQIAARNYGDLAAQAMRSYGKQSAVTRAMDDARRRCLQQVADLCEVALVVETTRLRTATVERGFNPNQPRDSQGRFGSTDGGSRPIVRQCATCGLILSVHSPLHGQHVPDDPSERRSHTFCKSCHRKMIMGEFARRYHLSQHEALAMHRSLWKQSAGERRATRQRELAWLKRQRGTA